MQKRHIPAQHSAYKFTCVVQSMTASAYVFCAQLQTALPSATHSTSITFPLVQDTRPITADWPALADTNGSWIYFDAQIQ